MFSVQIQTEPIALANEGGESIAPTPDIGNTGAQVRFVGRVRNDAQSSALSHLVLEHFPGVTEAEIQRIVELAHQRWDLQSARVVHRVGTIAVGEDIVLVETASKHRLAAYEANAFIMDYLKTEAPFWKQECFGDGSAQWVAAKASDQHILQRWESATAQAASSAATAPTIGALILAGGQGRRMGYANKGLQLLGQHALIEHVIQRLQPQVSAIAISANHALDSYARWGLPVHSDLATLQGQGPAAGILSASSHLPPGLDALLIVPCDTPYLPLNLVERLWQALNAPDQAAAALAVMACSASGPHPSVVLCRPAALLRLWAHIQQQPHPSLRSWLEPMGAGQVFFDDDHAFTNVNDLASLQALQSAASTASAPASTPSR